MQKFFDETLIKFLLVGLINTAVGTAIMFFLYNLAGFAYWPATAANYICGGIVSYILNKSLTFQNKKNSKTQFVKFGVTILVCWAVAYAVAKPMVVWVLSEYPLRIQENISMLVGMCLYTGLNYVGQRFFVFTQ